MASYEKCLIDTIASYSIPSDICKALNLSNQSQLIRSNRLRRLLFKLNASLTNWLADFNRISLVGSHSLPKDAASQPRRKSRLLSGNLIGTRKIWPVVVLIVYLILTVVVAIDTWFQYVHDINLTKLNRMEEFLRLSSGDERDNLTGDLHLDADLLRRQFTKNIKESRHVLELMGASLIEWTFLTEAFYVLLFQSLDWLITTPIRSRFHCWILLASKTILNVDDETKARTQMILAEQERFKQDSLLFSQARLMRLKRNLKLALNQHFPPDWSPSQIGRDGGKLGLIISKVLSIEQRRLDRSHEADMRRFKLVALRGRLNPLNRTPANRDKLVLLNLFTYISYFLYTNIVLAIVLYALSRFFERRRLWELPARIEGLKDLWSYSYHVTLTEIATLSASFYLSTFACAILDQLELVKRVRALFLVVMRANGRRLERLMLMGDPKKKKKPPNDLSLIGCIDCSERFLPEAQLGQIIELDLIMLLTQFRLAMASFELAHEPLQRISYSTLVFALSIPFVWMIHCAYLEAELRLIVLSSCSAATLCCLTFLAPVAFLNKRHTELVTSLWTLVAQLAHYEQVPHANQRTHLNTSTSLFIFRRLLTDPERLIARLTVNVLSMPVTYTNLFRMFTYCVVFMMAGGFMTLRLFGDGLAIIMMDPFSLFSFLRIN